MNAQDIQIQDEICSKNIASAQRNRHKQQGFTLIEIMVVVVILGILGALVAPSILGRPDEARVTVAKNDIRSISNALDMYKLDNLRYPTNEEGLRALVEKPTTAKNWNPDGYLPQMPEDPWGSAYIYKRPGEKSRHFDLYSLGADGQVGGEGTDADIGNWDK
ncbi:type II secretion system major pseudopilin GspG [Oceanospirillum sp.]|uniref:type II secretion system major pseudopilin GspG n=1 Tax=Oceanospirillum sp. TaxID=2021254 RepID=UPI003A8D4656